MCNILMPHIPYLSDKLNQEIFFEGKKEINLEFTYRDSNQAHPIYLTQYFVAIKSQLN